jgi:hypothetical protein
VRWVVGGGQPRGGRDTAYVLTLRDAPFERLVVGRCVTSADPLAATTGETPPPPRDAPPVGTCSSGPDGATMPAPTGA